MARKGLNKHTLFTRTTKREGDRHFSYLLALHCVEILIGTFTKLAYILNSLMAFNQVSINTKSGYLLSDLNKLKLTLQASVQMNFLPVFCLFVFCLLLSTSCYFCTISATAATLRWGQNAKTLVYLGLGAC